MSTLNDQYTREIDRFWRDIDSMYHELAVRLDLSDSSFDILYAIVRLGEGCTQKDIGTEVLLSKQTLNTSIHKLAKQGLLELRSEGRTTQIFLTPQGRKVVKQKINPVFDAESCALETIGTHDANEFLRILKAYQEALRSALEAVK